MPLFFKKKSFFFVAYCCTAILCYSQERDILEVARIQIPQYTLLEFTPNGEFAYGYKEDDNTLSILQTKNAQVVAQMPFEGQHLERICFSPNGQLMLTTNSNDIALWSVDSAKLLFSFLKNGARNLDISPDSRFYATTSDNNRFDIVDLLTREGVSYNIPTYLEGKNYKSNLVRCLFSKKFNKLFLVDVGYGEETTTYKSGLHINIIPFDLKDNTLMKPIELFLSNLKTYTSSDFTEISNTPDGRFLIITLKNKMIYYDIATKKKKELDNIEIVKKITYDTSGKFMLTSGLNTTTLWELTEANVFRQLKKFVGGSTTLTFTPDKRYIITLTANKNALIAWDIKEALLIRTSPNEYIQRSSQKYAKIGFLEWLKIRKGEKPLQYRERISIKNQDKKRASLVNEAVALFCNEVFGVGADYLILNQSESDEVVTLQTDGFSPLHFNISDSAEHARFAKYFLRGFYRWKKPQFKINKKEVVITRISLHMNYNKTYEYNIADDPETKDLMETIFDLQYSDYKLEEDKVE